MGRGGELLFRIDKVLNNYVGINCFYIYFLVYMTVHMPMHVHTKVRVWRSKVCLWKVVLSYMWVAGIGLRSSKVDNKDFTC